MVKRSKFQTGKLAGWQYVLILLFSLAALSAGIPKLFAFDAMLENMARLGYGQLITQFIGLVWVLIALGTWFARYRGYASLLTLFIAAGAVGTHYAIGDGFVFAIIPHVVLALITLGFTGFYKKLSEI
jgi:hypothetical protein